MLLLALGLNIFQRRAWVSCKVVLLDSHCLNTVSFFSIKKVSLLTEDATRSRDWVRELGSDGTDGDRGKSQCNKTCQTGGRAD